MRLLFLILFFISSVVFAKPPEAPPVPDNNSDLAAVEKLDAEGSDECKQFLRYRSGDPKKMYDDCMAKYAAKKLAEEEAKRRLEEEANKPVASDQAKIEVQNATPKSANVIGDDDDESKCKPKEAFKNCQVRLTSSSEIRAYETNGVIISEAIQNCRDYCTVNSMPVKKYYWGCAYDSDTKKYTNEVEGILKEITAMKERCGNSSNQDKVVEAAEDIKDNAEILALKYGYCEKEGYIYGGGKTCSRTLNDGVVAQTTTYGDKTTISYIGADGKYYPTREGARFAAAPIDAASVNCSRPGDPRCGPVMPPVVAPIITGGGGAGTGEIVDGGGSGSTGDDSGATVTPTPVPKPTPRPDLTPQQTALTQEKSTTPKAQDPRTVNPNPSFQNNVPQQSLVSQSAQTGGFLQNALNSPIARNDGSEVTGGGSSSASSVRGVSSETTRAGSSFSGEAISGGAGTGRPLPSKENEGLQQASFDPIKPQQLGGAPGGISTASLDRQKIDPTFKPGYLSESFREQFYKRDAHGNPLVARKVPVDPNCKAGAKKTCKMKTVYLALKKNKKGFNCDGDAECLLRLTGKLQLKKGARTTGDRQIASVEDNGTQRKRLPKGVWEGNTDVLNHFWNVLGNYPLDHEGSLSLDLENPEN